MYLIYNLNFLNINGLLIYFCDFMLVNLIGIGLLLIDYNFL